MRKLIQFLSFESSLWVVVGSPCGLWVSSRELHGCHSDLGSVFSEKKMVVSTAQPTSHL